MSSYTITECRTEHLRRILPILRQGDRDELAATGLNPKHHVFALWRNSSISRVALVDGEVAAVWGCIAPMASASADMWLLTSPAVEKMPLAFFRETRREVAEVLTVHPVLRTQVGADYKEAIRFFRMLGFSVGPKKLYWNTMLPYREMVLERGAPSGHVTKTHESAPPFVIFALPRSGTRWLSACLSYGPWDCHHDLPVSISSLSELFDTLGSAHTGTVETGLAAGWRAIREHFPTVRFAVVRRPVNEVRASAARFGWTFPDGYLEQQDAVLDEIAALPGTLSVQFDELFSPPACTRLARHCIGAEPSSEWVSHFLARNIQIDMNERMLALTARRDTISALFQQIRDTVTIQIEPFETFYRDGQTLFREHAAEAGPINGLPLNPNVRFARAMEANGGFVAATARVSGKMIGYIVFLINESFESADVLIAHQNIFFVRRGHRGRGPKIRNFAKAELRARGVRFILGRSGVRASGAKQKHVFMREGGQYQGELYLIPLGGP